MPLFRGHQGVQLVDNDSALEQQEDVEDPQRIAEKELPRRGDAPEICSLDKVPDQGRGQTLEAPCILGRKTL